MLLFFFSFLWLLVFIFAFIQCCSGSSKKKGNEKLFEEEHSHRSSENDEIYQTSFFLLSFSIYLTCIKEYFLIALKWRNGLCIKACCRIWFTYVQARTNETIIKKEKLANTRNLLAHCQKSERVSEREKKGRNRASIRNSYPLKFVKNENKTAVLRFLSKLHYILFSSDECAEFHTIDEDESSKKKTPRRNSFESGNLCVTWLETIGVQFFVVGLTEIRRRHTRTYFNIKLFSSE